MSEFICQTLVDKISDDFQSTFFEVSPGVFSNLFFEREIPEIEKIFKRHMGQDVKLKFHKQDEIAKDYFMWIIEVRK